MHIFSGTHLSTYLLAGLVATFGITGIGALPVQSTELLSLYKRNLQHPGPKDHSFLFHGTTARYEGQVKRKVLLKETSNVGDLHCNPDAGKGDSDGGFYMTDSAMAAAQFVCWGDPKLGTGGKKDPKVSQNDRVAHVLMFRWEPGNEVRGRVTTLEEQEASDEEKVDGLCKGQDVLSGPMQAHSDDQLTKDFWQLAIVRQSVADKYLKYKNTIKIHCDYVPKGDALTQDIYAKTKYTGPNPEFDALMLGKASTTPPGSPKISGNSKIPGSPKPPASPGKKSPPPSSAKPPASPKPPASAGKKTPPPSSPKRPASPGKKSPPPASKGRSPVGKPGLTKSPSAQPKRK